MCIARDARYCKNERTRSNGFSPNLVAAVYVPLCRNTQQCPLFRPLLRKTQAFRPWTPADKRKKQNEQGQLSAHNVCRMVNRRMKQAGLREELSAHSFRVAVLTDLIDQGVSIEDVQELAGHADPRTTKLYDRTKRGVTRNLVERIRLDLTGRSPSSTPDNVQAEIREVVDPAA